MTEEEAKTKWCPFYRFATGGGVEPSYGDNRPRDGESVKNADGSYSWMRKGIMSEASCISSACMAWRWQITPDDATRYKRSGSPEVPGTVAVGYCGLAGNPRG